MKQEYHSNAVTNISMRKLIKESGLTNSELANRYNISEVTISKWKSRTTLQDKSSRPNNIEYALNDVEQTLCVSLRQSTWLPLDEVWEMLLDINHKISRSSVYRLFLRNGINKVPEKEKKSLKNLRNMIPDIYIWT